MVLHVDKIKVIDNILHILAIDNSNRFGKNLEMLTDRTIQYVEIQSDTIDSSCSKEY